MASFSLSHTMSTNYLRAFGLSCGPNRVLLALRKPDQRGRTPVRWALPIICLLAAGCANPAITLPTTGALRDEQVGGGIHRIALPKGAGVDCASADECTLVEAAEAAQRVGGTHFMLLPGHGGTTQRGYAYIKVFTFGAGESAPSGAMSVEETLYFFRRPHGQFAG